MAVITMSTTTIAATASVALISSMNVTNVIKQVNLPAWTPGKFIYVMDQNGGATASPFAIATGSYSTIIVGTAATIIYQGGGGGAASTFPAGINRNFGSMAFVAGGTTTVSATPTQYWYCVVNEGGQDIFANITASGYVSTLSSYSVYISTTQIDAGIVKTGNLQLTGSLSLGGGVSTTTTISTNDAYIQNLTVGNASDGGSLNMAGLVTAGAGLSTTSISTQNAYIAATLTAGGTTVTSISNSGALNQAGLTTLYAGLSTTSISTQNAYITNLTVGTESDSGSLSTNTLTTTGQTTHQASVTITTGGLNVIGLSLLSNGLSTTSISTGAAYVTALTVGSISNVSNIYASNITSLAVSSITISTNTMNAGTVSGSNATTINICNFTGTSLASSNIITGTSGIYYNLVNSAFSNCYIPTSAGNGWYFVLRNNTSAFLSISTANLAINYSGYFPIPPSNSVTILYSAGNGCNNYVFF